MLLLITPYNRSKYLFYLSQSFKVRYKVFVETLKWDLPCQDSGVEIDQYDTDSTYYILKISTENKVIGGQRFCAMEGSFMLKDIFSNLVEESHHAFLKDRKDYFEFSRFFICPLFKEKATKQETHRLFCELMIGAQEFGILMNLKGFVAVTEEKLRTIYRGLGMEGTLLGKQKPFGTSSIFAEALEVNPRVYKNLCQSYQKLDGTPHLTYLWRDPSKIAKL